MTPNKTVEERIKDFHDRFPSRNPDTVKPITDWLHTNFNQALMSEVMKQLDKKQKVVAGGKAIMSSAVFRYCGYHCSDDLLNYLQQAKEE